MASGLLKWANLYTRGHDNVAPAQDLNVSWGDGLLFCALLHTWFPDKIPMKTLKAETMQDKLNNLALAFRVCVFSDSTTYVAKVAEEEAGAQPFLDPEDTVEVQDTKSIMVYLNEIYANVNSRPVKFVPTAAWVRAWEEKERKAKEDELRRKLEADKAAAAGLEPAPNVKLDGLAAKMAAKRAEEEAREKEEEERLRASGASLLAKRNEPSPEDIEEMNRLREEAKRKMEERKRKAAEDKAAAAEAEAKKRQEMLDKQAALEREVLEKRAKEGVQKIDAADVAYSITKGAKGGPVKAMLIFTINVTVGGKKPSAGIKTDLEVLIEGPSQNIRVNVMGGPGGTFHVGFTPTEAGQHWVDFIYLGAMVQKAPLCLEISDKGKCPNFEYTGKLKKEWEAKNGGANIAEAKAEEARKKLEEEAKKKAEEEAKKKAQDEAANKKAEEEAKKKAEEEEAKRKAEEAKKAAEEEAKRQAEEEEARKKAEADAAKKAAEEEEKRIEEEARKQIEAEEAAKKQAEEARRAAEEEAKRIEEEARRQIEEEEAAKKAEADSAAAAAEAAQKAVEEAEKAAAAAAAHAEALAAAAAAAAKQLEEAEKAETARLAEVERQKEQAAAELQAAEAALASSGAITEEEMNAMREEARQIAIAVVPDAVDSSEAKHVALSAVTLTFHTLTNFGKELTHGGATDHFVVSSNGVASSALTDRGDGSYSFVHKIAPGVNTVDVTFGGAHVSGFPLQFTAPTSDEFVAAKAAAEAKVEAERANVIKEELARLVAEKQKERSAAAAQAVEKAAQAKAAQEAAAQKSTQEAAAQKAAAEADAAKASAVAAAAKEQHTKAEADADDAKKPASSIRSMFENKVAQERAESAGLPKSTSTGPNKTASGRGRNALASRWEQTVKGNSK